MKNNHLYIYIIIILIASSCIPKKKVIYVQGNQDFNNVSSNYEPIIQNDDEISINVSAQESAASAPFNLDYKSDGANGGSSSQRQSYLVDNYGKIDFPILGTITVAGYSVKGLKELLKEKLALYIKDPVINIRILNFKVAILGEVSSPGTISVSSERLTLLEAIAKSGDLTSYGIRTNILIIRDFQGIKTFNRVDITKADFVNSPFYYLDQNDVVYIEARKAKIDATAIGSNVTTILSIVSFALTITLILTN